MQDKNKTDIDPNTESCLVTSGSTKENQKLVIAIFALLNRQITGLDTIREILAVVKEFTGCEAVGIRLRHGEDFPYFVTQGFPGYFVEAENFLCVYNKDDEVLRDSSGNPVLECMCGNVICGRTDASLPFFSEEGSFWTNSTTELLASTTEQDRQSRTRNRCNGEGYESVALIPLRSDSEVIGLLQLNDSRKNCFTAEMIRFMEGIGASVGIVLVRLKDEEARRESEEKYRTVADENLRNKTEILRSLFESSSEAIYILTRQGVVEMWNPAAERIFGWTAGEVLGCLNPTVPDGKREEFDMLLERTLNGESFSRLEVTRRKKDGSAVEISLSTTPLMGPDGNFEGLLAMSADITERKRLEELLKQRTIDLERSNKDLEQFAYVAAHDLREPLVAVAAYLKVLERISKNLIEESGQKCIAKAMNLVLRMDAMLQGLLAYSRTAITLPSHEMTDCNTCLADTLSNLGLSIKKSGAIVTSDTLPTVNINSSQVVLIFQNLIGNAIKFKNSAPPRVHVGCISKETYHQFSVSDNGIGIEPPYLDRIFEMFERVKDLSGPMGTGIGLSTCRKIVERYGGRIWVDSKVGKGSTFYFTLPMEII